MRQTSRDRRPARAVALALAMALAVTACSDSGGVGGQKDASQQTSGPVTLQYWTWFPAQDTVNKVISAYEQANPGVTISLHEYSNTDYQKQLPLALNGGQSVDIAGVQIAAMTNSVNANLRPVSQWESQLPPGWRDQLESKPLQQTQSIAKDKTLYSIPMGSIGSAFMYYNAAMLAKLGMTPPATAAELVAAAAKVKSAMPGVTPVVFGGEPYWQDEMLFTIVGQTNPGLSDQIQNKDGKWNDPAVVKGLADYKSLFTSGAVDSSVLSLKAPRPTDLFTGGQAAFYVDGSWEDSLLSSAYRTANKIGLTDVGAMTLPITDTGGKPASRGYAEGGLAIPKSSSHVEAAAKFIAYMTMGDGVSLWAPDLVLAPAKKGFQPGADVLTSPAARSGYQAVQTALNAPGSDRNGQQDFSNQVEGNDILDVLNGSKTPQQAADDMQAQWTSGRYPHGGQ
jgi:raffinose/stachyose/melibiose transport system substrate-binding protein